MSRKGLTREERMAIKAEQEAESRAAFDRLFPGVMEPLDAMSRMTQKAVAAYRKEHSQYRPASEYEMALNRLCGNPRLDDDDLERNIETGTRACRKKKGGAAA